MTDPLLRRAATAAAALTAAAGVAVLWLAVRVPELADGDVAGSLAVGPFVTGMAVLAMTGALVVRTHPRGAIGWLLVTGGLTGVLARLEFGLAVLADDHEHPLAATLGWASNWIWVPAQALALLLIMRFPDGRLPSERWWPVQWAVVVWAGLTCLVTAVLPGQLGATELAPRTNPLGIEPLGPFLEAPLDTLFLIQPLLALAAVLAPVVRWRSSPPAERRQLRAVALALLLVAAAAPLALASGAGAVLEGIAWLVLPAAIAYAVARHDLFDLDLRRRFDRLRRVREEERRRLQRDLHDSLGPLLGAISMRTEAARNLVAVQAPPAEIDRLLAAIGGEAEAAVVEVRRFIDELGPSALADTDLVSALRELADRYADSGIRIELAVPPTSPPLDPAVEVAAYRVASEALRNAVRHSGAATCWLTLHVSGTGLEVEVRDDGLGLRGAPAGVGRRAMADRVAALGGTFCLEEPADGGVVVRARLAEAVS